MNVRLPLTHTPKQDLLSMFEPKAFRMPLTPPPTLHSRQCDCHFSDFIHSGTGSALEFTRAQPRVFQLLSPWNRAVRTMALPAFAAGCLANCSSGTLPTLPATLLLATQRDMCPSYPSCGRRNAQLQPLYTWPLVPLLTRLLPTDTTLKTAPWRQHWHAAATWLRRSICGPAANVFATP
jgi:hypothetical protein